MPSVPDYMKGGENYGLSGYLYKLLRQLGLSNNRYLFVKKYLLSQCLQTLLRYF